MRLALGLLGGLGLAAVARAQTTAKPPEYYNAMWSPDSRSIAFESTRDGQSAVFTVSLDGVLKRLTSATTSDMQPDWSPDGARIAFVSSRDGHGEIYDMKPDGSDQRRLTTTPADRQHYAPRYSRDGRVIMFAFTLRRGIYAVGIVGADGRDMRQLSDSSVSSEDPRWSNDGAWIVFERPPALERKPGESNRDFALRHQRAKAFFAMRPDGSGFKRLADDDPLNDQKAGQDGAQPLASPDGRWSVRVKSGVDGGVFLIDKSTGRERQLAGA